MSGTLGALSKVSTRLLCPRHRLLVLPCASKFWEPDHRGGYDTKIRKPFKQNFKEGIHRMGPELKKWTGEWQRKLRCDDIIAAEHGDYEVLWKFDSDDTVCSWIVTVDSDHAEGKSKAELVLGRHKTGIFRGTINTEIPKDGITKRAGYVNIKSPSRFVRLTTTFIIGTVQNPSKGLHTMEINFHLI